MAASDCVVHVVDDDASFRTSVARLLRAAGYTAEAFDSAAAFLGRPIQRPGCLLVDVHMPAMSGLELVEELKARRADMPAVFVTGRTDALLVDAVERAGAVTLLVKPVRAQDLFDAIGRAVDACESRRRSA